MIATHASVGQEPTAAFDELYKSMKGVFGFGSGRLGRFDFLGIKDGCPDGNQKKEDLGRREGHRG